MMLDALILRAAVVTLAALFILMMLLSYARTQPVRQTYKDCHHNARGQLVCRPCFVENGKWRCNQPRIVREPAPGWRA